MGRTFEDAISLDYMPPRKVFATYTKYYDTAKVHVHSKNDRQHCLWSCCGLPTSARRAATSTQGP